MQTQLTAYQTRINQQLKTVLQQFEKRQISHQHPLFDAIEYATLNSGKRLRPALSYAIAEALNISHSQIDSSACAIELIHSYSLVHDDLPAMDNDDLRRGQATCHIKYDEATAILVGDAQQSLAIQLISEDLQLEPKHALEIITLLSDSSGALGMISGQMLDIQAESKTISLNELKTLHLLKTGRLIQCALLLGAVQHPEYSAIKQPLLKLGEYLGLAFQVQDDILDIESDTDTLGKPQGSDLALDKSTYPKLLGMQAAKDYRDQLIMHAKQQMQSLNLKSEFLEALIDYIGNRPY